jgi:transposase-like protein
MAGRPRDPDREQSWRRHVERQPATGLTIRAYCARHDLLESSFYRWRRVLAERGRSPAPAFVPVTIVGPAARPTGPAIDITLAGGHRLRVRPGCDRDLLAAVLGLLGGRPC